jgi:endo-1,4-beta-D-glucanase Y
MFRIFLLLCLFAFISCSTDEPPNGGTSSNSGNVNIGSHLSLPSNANIPIIGERYETWMSKYYVTYEEEASSITENQKKEGLEGSARIKWSPASQTVSEGIGYGMLLAALNKDKGRFDRLWKYSKAYRMGGSESINLMNWNIDGFKKFILGPGSASDADIDILASLIIMYEKLGVQDYLNDAIAIGKSMWDKELGTDSYNNRLLLPAVNTSSWSGRSVKNTINISYISLAAIKLLAIYDTERNWNSVLEANIAYMQRVQNAGNGLWPDWSDPDSGEPVHPGNSSCTAITASDASSNSTCFVYNKESVRIPWRVAWYYHWFGDSRAKEMLDKAHAFVASKTNSNPNSIKAWYGYNDGKEPSGNGGVTMWTSLCATGLASLANSVWNEACNQKFLSQDVSGGSYYSDSLYMLYLMLFNGGFQL